DDQGRSDVAVGEEHGGRPVTDGGSAPIPPAAASLVRRGAHFCFWMFSLIAAIIFLAAASGAVFWLRTAFNASPAGVHTWPIDGMFGNGTLDSAWDLKPCVAGLSLSAASSYAAFQA